MTEARNERLKVLIEAKNEAAREMPVDWLTAAKMPTVDIDWLTAAKMPTVDIDRLTAGLTIGQAAAMGLQSAEWQALAAKVEASINPAQFLHKDLSNLAGQAFAPLTSRIREDLSQTFAHLTSFSTEQLGLVGSAMMQQAIRQAAEIRIENFGAYADLWPERLIKPEPLLPWPAERPEPGKVQAVHIAEPELLHLVEQKIKSNQISQKSKRALLALLMDNTDTEGKPGQQEAPLEIQIELNERYESLKRRHGRDFTQEIFVRFHASEIYPCSLATFERYRANVKRRKKIGLL